MDLTEEILSQKITFMLKRERIGYSRAAFAERFGVQHRSVRRWESITAPYLPNNDAIQMLDDLNELLDKEVSRTVTNVLTETKVLGRKPEVNLYYYAGQSVYEHCNPESTQYFGFSNAITREVYDVLNMMGYVVHIHAHVF